MLNEKSDPTPDISELIEISRAARVVSLRLRKDLGKLCQQVHSEVNRAQEIALSVNRRSVLVQKSRRVLPRAEVSRLALALPAGRGLPADSPSRDTDRARTPGTEVNR